MMFWSGRARSGAAPLEAIPREYNFAADLAQSRCRPRRQARLIDHRQGWTYGDLAERVERFGHVLRALGLRREERVSVSPRYHRLARQPFSAPSRPVSVPLPVNTL